MIDQSTLDRLRRLSPNWDSYGGVPTTQAAADTAANILVVPRSNGGLAIVLQAGGVYLDIDIEPDGRVDPDILVERWPADRPGEKGKGR